MAWPVGQADHLFDDRPITTQHIITVQRVLLLISRASLDDLKAYIGLKVICTSLLDRMMSFMNSIGSAASSSASSTASSSASATASSIAPIVSTVVEKVSIKSSWVWEYFSTDAKDKYPICNICSIEVNYGQSKSTSKLSNHIFHQHRDVYDNYQSNEAAKKRKGVGTLEAFVVYGGDFIKEYIRWIVETFQPISTCDNPFFRRMCNS